MGVCKKGKMKKEKKRRKEIKGKKGTFINVREKKGKQERINIKNEGQFKDSRKQHKSKKERD